MPKTPAERCKKWRGTHPEHMKTEKYRASHKESMIRYQHGGFDYKEKEKLFLAQQGRCPICNLALPEIESFNCVIDHDHVTGMVRGLLHRICNVWVGYIEKHGKEVLDRA